MNQHSAFIATPMSSLLDEFNFSVSSLTPMMETSTLSEYLLRALFLKMTGFQEQKMKCVCWTIANNNFDYRAELLRDKLGECSSKEDKQNVIVLLRDKIQDLDSNFDVVKYISAWDLCQMSDMYLQKWYSLCPIKESLSLHYQDYQDFFKKVPLQNTCFICSNKKKPLMEHCEGCTPKKNCIIKLDVLSMSDVYKLVYNHRNRCAHNLESYQPNFPDLDRIVSVKSKYDNYFVRFFILLVIDDIVRYLYAKYESLL